MAISGVFHGRNLLFVSVVSSDRVERLEEVERHQGEGTGYFQVAVDHFDHVQILFKLFDDIRCRNEVVIIFERSNKN